MYFNRSPPRLPFFSVQSQEMDDDPVNSDEEEEDVFRDMLPTFVPGVIEDEVKVPQIPDFTVFDEVMPPLEVMPLLKVSGLRPEDSVLPIARCPIRCHSTTRVPRDRDPMRRVRDAAEQHCLSCTPLRNMGVRCDVPGASFVLQPFDDGDPATYVGTFRRIDGDCLAFSAAVATILECC